MSKEMDSIFKEWLSGIGMSSIYGMILFTVGLFVGSLMSIVEMRPLLGNSYKLIPLGFVVWLGGYWLFLVQERAGNRFNGIFWVLLVGWGHFFIFLGLWIPMWLIQFL